VRGCHLLSGGWYHCVIPYSACQFYATFKKVCWPYEHQICSGICLNNWVIFSMESPTLATVHYSSPDNAIGLVAKCELSGYVILGYLLEAVGQKFSYYYQCWCWANVTDSNRKIKNVKTAIKNANLCGKKYEDMRPLLKQAWKCGNVRNTRQLHICIKLTCLPYDIRVPVAVWQLCKLLQPPVTLLTLFIHFLISTTTGAQLKKCPNCLYCETNN